MASDITNYAQFKQQAAAIQTEANTKQDVSDDDLKSLTDYLNSDDAKGNLTQGQIDSMESTIAQLKMVVDASTQNPTQSTAAAAFDGMYHGSDATNKTWSTNMDALIQSINTSSTGAGTQGVPGIKDPSGKNVAIPANTPLAQAAQASGAVVTPVKNSDGTPNDMVVVKDQSGNQQMYGSDGNPIGQPVAQSGGENIFKISNPAPGQDPYVSLSADGTVKTGKDPVSVGGTAGGNAVVQNITGTGAGGYTTGQMSWIDNNSGNDTGATAGQATGFHDAYATVQANPDSALAQAIKDDSTGARTPGHQALDPTTGNIAVSVQDPTTKAYSLKFFDPKTGADQTAAVAADTTKTPSVSLNTDGTIANSAATAPATAPTSAAATNPPAAVGGNDYQNAIAQSGATPVKDISTGSFNTILGVQQVNSTDASGKPQHQLFDQNGNKLGDPVANGDKTLYQVTNPAKGQNKFFWVDESGKIQSGNSAPKGYNDPTLLTGNGSGGYTRQAAAAGGVQTNATTADGKVKGLTVQQGTTNGATTYQLFDNNGNAITDAAPLAGKAGYEIMNPAPGQDKFVWLDGNGDLQSGDKLPAGFTVANELTGDGAGGYKSFKVPPAESFV